MATVLITGRKNQESAEELDYEQALAFMRGHAAEGDKVLSDDDMDWGEILRTHGGSFEAAGREHLSVHFEGIMIIEGRDKQGYFLSKGLYTFGLAMLQSGRYVAVWRNGKPCAVQGFRIVDANNWKGRHAEALASF